MNRFSNFLSAVWNFVKKYKIIFIVILVVILFVFGLIRDNNKRKKSNDINYNTDLIPSSDTKVVKISGGVNKDYYGYNRR